MSNNSKIAELRRRAADIGDKVLSICERRKLLSPDAADGNKAANDAIQRLDAETDALSKQHATVTAAIEQLERKQQSLDAEAARKEREGREAEALKINDAVTTLNSEIDRAMKQLHEMFDRRKYLIQQLGRTSTVDQTIILKMLQKYWPTAAARAAGLHNFLSIEHVPQQHVAPLAKASPPLPRAAA